MAGIARENVCRILNDWKRRKLVSRLNLPTVANVRGAVEGRLRGSGQNSFHRNCGDRCQRCSPVLSASPTKWFPRAKLETEILRLAARVPHRLRHGQDCTGDSGKIGLPDSLTNDDPQCKGSGVRHSQEAESAAQHRHCGLVAAPATRRLPGSVRPGRHVVVPDRQSKLMVAVRAPKNASLGPATRHWHDRDQMHFPTTTAIG